MKSLAEVLRAARERVAEGWTQGAMARDERGEETEPTESEAVCYCALGALESIDRGSRSVGAFVLRLALPRFVLGCAPDSMVANFNDDPATTQADVLALFDRAIAAEGGAQ